MVTVPVPCRFVSIAGDALALLYNDTSVLENHHCMVAFKLMQREGCNVLESFGRKKYHVIRRIIVDMASFLSSPGVPDVTDLNIYRRSDIRSDRRL